MNFDIVESLNRYINNTSEPIRWLPILVLVYLLFELRSLRLFEKEEVVQHYHQLTKEELLVLLLGARLKILFLVFLLAFVSWILFFKFLFYDGLVNSLKRLFSVIPAQAGIQYFHVVRIFWIPVFTGMTTFYESIILCPTIIRLQIIIC